MLGILPRVMKINSFFLFQGLQFLMSLFLPFLWKRILLESIAHSSVAPLPWKLTDFAHQVLIAGKSDLSSGLTTRRIPFKHQKANAILLMSHEAIILYLCWNLPVHSDNGRSQHKSCSQLRIPRAYPSNAKSHTPRLPPARKRWINHLWAYNRWDSVRHFLWSIIIYLGRPRWPPNCLHQVSRAWATKRVSCNF